MRQKHVILLTQAAMIAAIYVVLTYLCAAISFGEIQVRIAEALTILPVFTPAAIPGLWIGCLLGNLLGGAILPDIILGSLATLLGALGTWILRKKPTFLATLPPVISNTILVPCLLRFAYGITLPFPVLMFSVGMGECLSCIVLGLLLHRVLARYQGAIFPT